MRRLLLVLILVLTPGTTRATEAAPPACLVASDQIPFYEVPVSFERDGIRLSGRLFLPRTPGPHPAVLFLHGGGRENLTEAPLFFAPLMARCGLAAFVYDKRGTGASEGTWASATLDDFVQDALAAVETLRRHPAVNGLHIGLVGFSQGGRLAPIVAAQDPDIAFVVSLSAPFGSMRDTRLYALRLRLQQRGLTGDALETAFSLWERHLNAVAQGDHETLSALDVEVEKAAHRIRPSLLPPTSNRLPQTPVYNSLDHDYTPLLASLQAPLLALYGERDQTVPVDFSAATLRQTLDTYGHAAYEVRIIPFADHSFIDRTFQRRIQIEHTVMDWILDRLSDLQATEMRLTGTQPACLLPVP